MFAWSYKRGITRCARSTNLNEVAPGNCWSQISRPTALRWAPKWRTIQTFCACFRDVTDWLLQCNLCRSSEDDHWQAATSAQRRRLSSQRHEKVRSWSVDTTAWQTALAGCAWEGHLQARPHDVALSLSAWRGANEIVGEQASVRTSQGANKPGGKSTRHRGWISQGANRPWGEKAKRRTSQGPKKPGGETAKGQKSQTPCQPTPAHCTSLSTQHVRPSVFSSRWSDGLELTAR